MSLIVINGQQPKLINNNPKMPKVHSHIRQNAAIFFASLGMGPVPLILGIFDSRKAPNWEFSRREIRLIGNSV